MILGSNATISVYKLAYGTNTETYPSTATLSGVEAYIESQQAEMIAVLGEQANIETFLMYCDPIDIAKGDKVIDDQNREYRVIGAERHEQNKDTDDVIRVILRSQSSATH